MKSNPRGIAIAFCLILLLPACARAYYSPEQGRWISRDPIEEKGGLSLYAAVRNDPLDYWDRLGQKCCLRTYPKADGSPFGHSVLTCGANNEIYVSFFPQKGSLRGQIPKEGSWHTPEQDAIDYAKNPPTEVCTDCLDEGKIRDWLLKAKEDRTKFADTYNCSNAAKDAIAAGLPPEKQKKPECGKCSFLERLAGAVRKFPRDLLTQDTGYAGSASTGHLLITYPADLEGRFKDVVGNGCNRWKCDIQWNSRQSMIGP